MTPMANRRSNPSRWLADALMIALLVPLLPMVVYCLILSQKIFHPPRNRQVRPPVTSLPLEFVKIETADGVSLAGWLVRHPSAKGCVIICHEWGSYKATKLKYAEFLSEAGYDVLLFDLRNHGESAVDKAWGDMSRRYTDDLDAAISYVSRHPGLGGRPLAVLSFSFSTFPAMHCLAHRRPAGLSGLVFDSGPTWSEREITVNFLNVLGRFYFPQWLRGPILLPVASRLVSKMVSHFLRVQWPPPLASLDRPMLFICGEADEVAPPDAVRRLAERIPRGEVWVVPDSAHLHSFKQAPSEYRERVVEFLERVIQDPTT